MLTVCITCAILARRKEFRRVRRIRAGFRKSILTRTLTSLACTVIKAQEKKRKKEKYEKREEGRGKKKEKK